MERFPTKPATLSLLLTINLVVLVGCADPTADPEYQYDQGLMFDYGEGVAEDDAEAVKWYRLAADQGDA